MQQDVAGTEFRLNVGDVYQQLSDLNPRTLAVTCYPDIGATVHTLNTSQQRKCKQFDRREGIRTHKNDV